MARDGQYLARAGMSGDQPEACSACTDSDATAKLEGDHEVKVAGYSAKAMPTLIESSSRSAVTQSVPDLGPATFFAGDDAFEPLSLKRYDGAKFMYVGFWSSRAARVALVRRATWQRHGGSAPGTCKDAPGGGIASCSESRTQDGEVVRTRVSVGLLVPRVGEYQLVDYRTLDGEQWRNLRLERSV